MLKNILLVGFGGFAGSIARYLIYLIIDEKNLPAATFAVNMLGSLFLGALMGYFLQKGVESTAVRLFFAVGFCGSFTTFSTFAMENFQMIHDRNYIHLATYSLGSLILGIIMIGLGFWLGRSLG